MRYRNTGNETLNGLHVTARIDSNKCQFRTIDDSLIARHRDTQWMKMKQKAYVLPMNIHKVVSNPAPLPCNESLFEFLLSEDAHGPATIIALAEEPIINKEQAQGFKGIGEKSAEIIARFFQKQKNSKQKKRNFT